MPIRIQRRRFLGLCASGTIVGCVPDGAIAPFGTRRDAATSLAGHSSALDAGLWSDAAPPAPRPRIDSGQPYDSGSRATDDAGMPPDAGPTTPAPRDAGFADSGAPPADSGLHPDAECTDYVELYDMQAQALYLDRTFGPVFGLISIADVVAGQPVELEFWHGHGGRSHLFTLLPTHYEALKRLERVTIVTTEVDSHQHELFIDPVDPRYRAAGAQPIRVLTC